jgi:hypothetical protein
MERTYRGSCHCGAIRFEADVDLDQGIRKCNCSFCWKLGYRKALVPYEAVRIVSGKEAMREYRPIPSFWPPGDVNHYYCPTCGAHPFSRGYLEKEMGGNFWAVNIACLDDVTEEALAAAPLVYEDGKRDRQDRAPEITSYL